MWGPHSDVDENQYSCTSVGNLESGWGGAPIPGTLSDK